MKDQLKRLLKGSAIYGIGNALNQLISILLLPLFTRYLSPKDFGIVSLLTLLTFFINAVFTLGLGTSIGLKYFDGNNDRQKEITIWTSFIILLISGIILIFLGITFIDDIGSVLFNSSVHKYLIMLSIDYKYLIELSIFSAFFQVIVIPFVLRLQFEEKQFSYVFLTLMSTIITIGINVILIVVMGKGLVGKIEAGIISKIIFFLLFLIPTLRSVKFRFKLTISKDLLKYGLPMIPSFISLYILQKGNIYMLESMTSLETVGLYFIGFSIGSAIQLIVTAFTTAWVPFFLSFSEKQDEGKKLFGRVLTYYVFGIGIISSLFYFGAKPLLFIFIKPNFFEAYKVVGLTATAFSLLGVFSILLSPIFFAKEVKYSTLVQLISAGLFIILGVILIPPFGMIGAAISLIIGYLSMNILLQLWNYSKKDTYLNIKFEWRRLSLFTIVYTACIFFILWEKNMTILLDTFISFGGFILLLITTYLLLYSSEKQYIAKFLKPSHRKNNTL